MLYLVTGTPGAGKTLTTIKMALDLQKENPERKVYFFDIAECKVEGWTELPTVDDVHKWQDLPDNSIVIVDECYKVWKQRGPKIDPPLSAQGLAEHRHRGFDFYLITQSPKNLDVFVRRLIGVHYHFDRRFGANTVNRYMWNRVEEDPNDQWKKKEAVRESVKLDKKLFGLYKSAEVHTHKRRYPPKLIIAVVFIVLIPFLIYFFGGSLRIAEDPNIPEPEKGGFFSDLPGASPGGEQITEDRYLQLRTPRIEGWPHTAPIYDELMVPVAVPKYNCMMPQNKPQKCRCYSQQATVLDTTIAICLSIIERGFFDVTREDQSSSPPPSSRRRESANPSATTGEYKPSQNAILLGNG